MNIIKKNKFCYNCLSNFHILAQCNSKSTCFVCKTSYHHVLHHRYSKSGFGNFGALQNPDLLSEEKNTMNADFIGDVVPNSENAILSFNLIRKQ